MSKIALSYEEVMALQPCSKEFERVTRLLGGEGWNGRRIDAATARAAGCTLFDLNWVAAVVAENDPDVERRLQLWQADCAAHVLHFYEQTGTSDAPRKAIIAARRYARGEIDDAAWAAARDAARAAACDAAGAAAGDAAWAAAWDAAEDAARDAAGAAAWDAAEDAARDAAGAAARDAAWAAAWDAAEDAARDAAGAAARAVAGAAARAVAEDAEMEWQLDRLVAWLSDNEPEDWPLPARPEAEGRAA